MNPRVLFSEMPQHRMVLLGTFVLMGALLMPAGAGASPDISAQTSQTPFVWQETPETPAPDTIPHAAASQPMVPIAPEETPQAPLQAAPEEIQSREAGEVQETASNLQMPPDLPLASVVKSTEGNPPHETDNPLNAATQGPVRMVLSLLGVLGLFWLVAEKVLKPFAQRFTRSSSEHAPQSGSVLGEKPPSAGFSMMSLFSKPPSPRHSSYPSSSAYSSMSVNLPAQQDTPQNTPLMRLLGEQSLGGDRAVHLLQVHNRLLVVGASGQMLSVLSEFSAQDLPPACLPPQPEPDYLEASAEFPSDEFAIGALPSLPPERLPALPITTPMTTTRAAKASTRYVKPPQRPVPHPAPQVQQERLILLPDYQETY